MSENPGWLSGGALAWLREMLGMADFAAFNRAEAYFGAEPGAACWSEFSTKRLDAEAAEALSARLAERWDEFRACLGAVMGPATELDSVLKRAGAPTAPEDPHWPRPFYRDAVRHAREMRNRYTFLDLAADRGWLDDAEIL